MPLVPFCTDVDLLGYEPNIFRDAPFASQTLLAGTGTLDGTGFTIAAGSFEDSGVGADHVITLGGAVDGCFPIVSVDSGTAITVSVLHGNGPEARPPSGSGSLPFTIRTFHPQRLIVSELIAHAAGVRVTDDGEFEPAIMNPSALTRACALGALQMIYSALAAAAEDALAANRAAFYERQYRRAIHSATVDLDLDGDGRADAHRMLNILNFQRA